MASKYSITALGELLIDFTEVGTSQNGQKMFERNPGGAPANHPGRARPRPRSRLRAFL